MGWYDGDNEKRTPDWANKFMAVLIVVAAIAWTVKYLIEKLN